MRLLIAIVPFILFGLLVRFLADRAHPGQPRTIPDLGPDWHCWIEDAGKPQELHICERIINKRPAKY